MLCSIFVLPLIIIGFYQQLSVYCHRKQQLKICNSVNSACAVRVKTLVHGNSSSAISHSHCNGLIMEAVKTRSLKSVSKLLFDDEIDDNNISAASLLAYRLGYFEILDLLIQKGKIFLPNKFVEKAACHGRPNTVSVLLRNMRKVFPTMDVLVCAMKHGYAATALAILSYGNFSKNDIQIDVVSLAAESPNLLSRPLAKILQLGDYADSMTRIARDPLIVVAVRNKAAAKLVDLFIRRGADVNRKTSQGETALHWASRNNMTAVVKLLLKNGANLVVNRLGNTPLHYAAQFDASLEIMAELLRQRAFLESRNNVRCTPLLLALKGNASLELVRFLIDSGADLEAGDSGHTRALMWAVENERADLVRLLIDRGADLNATDAAYSSTIIYAADGPADIVKLLLNSRTNGFMLDVNAAENNGATALIYASQENKVENVRLLLDRGASVNARYMKENSSALFLALVNKASSEITQLLLDHGADPNDVMSGGVSILMVAAAQNDVKSVRLLLERNADPNVVQLRSRDTALFYATKNNVAPEIVRMLLQRRADPNITDSEDLTPLMYASSNSGLETIRLLILAGADVNAIGQSSNALKRAIFFNRSLEVVEFMIEHGADVNAPNLANGNTPLIYAVTNCRLDLCRILLLHGANVNEVNKQNNNTALITATYYNCSWGMIQFLVDNEANVNFSNANGETAIVFALKFNQTQSINILRERGASIPTFRKAVATSTTLVTTIASTGVPKKLDSSFRIISSKIVAEGKIHKLAMLILLDGFYKPDKIVIHPIGLPYSLNVRVASPNDPSSRKCLLEVLQFWLDSVNSRSEILPGYELELHYYGEDITQIFQPQVQADFIDRVPNDNVTTISPVVMGPLLLDWNRCVFWEGLERALHKQREKAFLSNIRFDECFDKEVHFDSSLVRQVDTKQLSELTLISFLKSPLFGFKWRRVALVGDSRDLDGLFHIPLYHKWLLNNGFKVSAVEIGDSYLDIFKRLTQKRSRIVFFTSYVKITCKQCAELWCSSYRANMQPTKFVFLMTGEECLRCIIDTVHVCSIEIQQKQMAMAFFGLVRSKAVRFRSYDENLFGLAFIHSILDTWKDPLPLPTRQCSKGDWLTLNRSFLHSIFLLHFGDEKLRRQYGTNLHDAIYEGTRNSSENVLHVISEAAADGEFRGSSSGDIYRYSRVGAVVQSNFDIKKLSRVWKFEESDSQPTWNGGNFEYRVVALVQGIIVKESYNASDNLTALSPILWPTQTGLPPNDLFNILVINMSYHDLSFKIVIAAACFITTFQLLLAILTLTSLRSAKKAKKGSTSQDVGLYSDNKNNLLLLGGCFLMNLSVITILSGTEFFLVTECFFQPLFCALGITTINSSIFTRMVMMPAYAHENRYITSKIRIKKSLFNQQFHEQQRQRKVQNLEKKVSIFTALKVFASAMLLLLWLASDQIVLKSAIENETDPLFDDDLDTFYSIKIEWCESVSQTYWIAILTVVECALLCFAGFFGLRLKRVIKFIRRRWKPEILRIRVAINNCVTIIIFVSLLMVVLPSRPLSLWYLKMLCFSLGQLLYSLSTSVIVCSSPLRAVYELLKGYTLSKNKQISTGI